MSILGALRVEYRRRPIFTVVAAITLAYFLVTPVIDWWLRNLNLVQSLSLHDWGAYSTAIIRWEEGRVLYEQNANGGYFGTFLYPPLTLLVFYPFHVLFDARPSRIIWGVFSLVLLWTAMQLLIRELGYRLRLWERGLLFWALLGFQPVWLSFKMGQTAGFLGALLCLSFVALSRQEHGSEQAGFLSGAFTGAVGFFKMAYAPVGAHLLDDFDRLTGALATGIVLIGLSIAIFGIELHLTYLEVLAWGASSGDPRPPTRQMFSPYFKPLGWLSFSLPLRVALSALIAGAALLAKDRSRQVFALGLAAFPVLTPTTYAYYLVAVLPAGLILLASELERDGYPTVPVVGLFLVNAHEYGLRFIAEYMHETYPWFASLNLNYFVLQPGLWGVTLIAGLAFFRVAETAEVPTWVRRLRTDAVR